MADPEAWPADALEAVERCPLCGSGERAALYRGLDDSLRLSPAGQWALCRCGRCGCAYLSPRPTRETIARAYANYHTHAAAGEPVGPESRSARLRRAVRNSYLNARYNFELKPALTAAGWAAAQVAACALTGFEQRDAASGTAPSSPSRQNKR